jgi:hypothetical protein
VISVEEKTDKPALVLTSFDTYMESGIEQFRWQLQNFFGDNELEVEHVKEQLANLNAYENMAHLKPIKQEHIVILDEDKIDTKEAEAVVLNGEFFWEHAAAGEATRLGLGTKYTIDLSAFTTQKILDLIRSEIETDHKNDPETMKRKISEVGEENLVKQMGGAPQKLLPMNLGTRHMLQMAFDLTKLAKKNGKKPEEVLSKQRMLIILNETTADKIIDEFMRYNYFGFARKNVMFMIQKSFHGIDIKKGEPFYDMSHDKHKRLHNHGQMVMQKTHDNAIFYIDDDKSERYLRSEEFEKILASTKDMVSYNIEDIDYLTNAIDWHSLALCLELGKKGYGMTMEIVAQNPLKPQKGGAAFWDEKKKRIVMIESNQLRGIKLEDITHLNKNFNHYPNPALAFKAVRDGNMHLHTDVKMAADKSGNPKYYIYFCTPQGDINFLVKTAYIMRKNLKPISSWKSPATTPPMINGCFAQDAQPGFKEFAERYVGKLKI